MSGPTFDGVGPFSPDDLSWSDRWQRCKWLAQACERHPESWPARHILMKDPHTAKRRDDALRLFNGLPALTKRHILSRYQAYVDRSRSAA